LIRAGKKQRSLGWKLATLGTLASPAFVLIFLAYLQSTPNTAGVISTGPFDGERAFADLKRIASFGPRPSSSPPLQRCRSFIIRELQRTNVHVSEDTFTATTPIGPIPMTNIVGTIPGASSSIMIIGGHYDTKRMATPFVGANDGGSSTAFLIELVRVLAGRKHRLTYWVVFFDGEESVQRWSASDSLYGSRHFARRLADKDIQDQIKAVIVVDMIADAHLDIHRETDSTPWLSILFSPKRTGSVTAAPFSAAAGALKATIWRSFSWAFLL
jgi:glutaminyl-peptide cyclotransferase